ncbi:MAG: leucine-rich repeat domain-containing protein [Thermoguttaceae bacterium]
MDAPAKQVPRWFQITLWTLALVFLAGIAMTWYAVRLQRARKRDATEARTQREVVEAIKQLGGHAIYWYPGAEPPRPKWLLEFLGVDFYADVVAVDLGTCWGGGTPSRATDGDLVHLKKLKELRQLALGYTQITDAGLEHLGGLSHLWMLLLNRVNITDAGLKHLRGLDRLEFLNLSGTKVSDAGLEHLRGLKQLNCLNLDATNITDTGMQSLKRLDHLEVLILDSTHVSDAGLEYLKGLNGLKQLSLLDTRVSGESVKKLQQAIPTCEIRY